MPIKFANNEQQLPTLVELIRFSSIYIKCLVYYTY